MAPLGRRTAQQISIHALLAESDQPPILIKPVIALISIHALLAESDGITDQTYDYVEQFLSTLSLRRATKQAQPDYGGTLFLSTLSLRRATHPGAVGQVEPQISIHALLAESDPPIEARCLTLRQFLSTLSLRRATSPPSVTPTASRNFYPRSPCGERLPVPLP